MSVLRHRVSVLAIVATLPLSGCGPMILRSVNSKFPPVSPEQRQLGAIETAHKAIASLSVPNSYAFIPTADLSNYVLTAAKYPFPLSSDQDILAAAPSLGSPSLTLGKQEIVFSSDFALDLKGTHLKMDMSGIKVRGTVDVRLYPELVPSAAGGNILGVRLRPAITSMRITAVDLSSSKHPILYWFQRRQAISTPINLALTTFRDNINGKLHLDVPFPLAPITVTSGQAGFSIQPTKLLAIQPGITSAVVRISPKGLLLASMLRMDILDPNNLPKPQPPIVLPPEPLPSQVSAARIESEYSQLDREVEGLVVEAFKAYKQDGIVASINKNLLSDAFNKIFNNQKITVSYSGPLDEQRVEGNDARCFGSPHNHA
jgi:hypothetical protein